jgi:uracil-DNA glycosylase family 4
MESNIFVPGSGPFGARVVIVGESPSHNEIRALKPFVGAAGKVLNELCAKAGINRESCWVTNACKYYVPPSPRGKNIPFDKRARAVGIDIDKQYMDLRTEICNLKPTLIIALGGTALWALTGKEPITSWRGSIIQAFGFKTIPTFHPASLLHQEDGGEAGTGAWQRPVMVLDLKRAAFQSTFPDLRLPIRTLQVCTSSYQLRDFLNRYRNYTRPAIDIEALGTCVPACIGIAFTPKEGLTVPLWNIRGISEIPIDDLVNCWKILAQFLANMEVIGQNFGYDRDKIRRLGFIVKRLISDTMYKSFCINPELPKSLDFNTSIYTEEPFYKNEGMYEGSIQDLFIGCARDACVTKEIDLCQDAEIDEMGLRKYYENFMLPLHELYAYNEGLDAIEQVGFRINEDERKALIRKYVEKKEKINYDLFKMIGEPINIRSPQQISKLLYEKLKIPHRKGTGEEVLTQLLNNVIKNQFHERIVGLILEGRRVNKTLDNYLMSPPDFDGRMRSSYFICLDTGRSSTSQQKEPIRPFLRYRDKKGQKKKQARGMAFQTITKHGDIGADVRKILVADEGFVFLQADSSQAEARVIFVLAKEDLRLFDEHDIHALTASWFFGGVESDYSKKVLGYETPKRFAGKTLRHAGHLGAHKRRAANEINTQARKYKINFKISEAAAGVALETFHQKAPNIRQVYHADVIDCLRRNRRLIAPVPYGIEAEVGGTRIFFERDGEELYREGYAYLPQRTVTENTKSAAMRIRRRANWIKILGESHDALLTMVPIGGKEEAAYVIREEMEKPIDFRTCSLKRDVDLVIPCDIEEGYNYFEMSKFRYEVAA